MYDWETHLEEVESLGTEEVEEYFLKSEEVVFQRFDEEYERFEETDPTDLTEEEVLELESPEIEYLLEEMKIAEKAETYATVYREIIGILDRTRNNSQHYTEEITQYKKLRDETLRNVDRFETIEIADNLVVEIIEEELNPVLTQVQSN